MATRRTGSVQQRGESLMVRVRVSRGVRLVLSFQGLSAAEVEARKRAIVEVANTARRVLHCVLGARDTRPVSEASEMKAPKRR